MEETESEIKPKIIYYVGYNYDSSFFSVGTDIGYQIYTTNPLNLIISRQLNGGIGIIKIMDKTNIFGLVGGGQRPRFIPNKLIIWDDIKSEIKDEYRCDSFIINCYMKQNCTFIICPDSITLVNPMTMKAIKIISTINNPKGICSVSNQPKKYVLTFPDKYKGHIMIMNFDELVQEKEKEKNNEIKSITNVEGKEIIIKNAHKSNINVLSLNFAGTKLASVSDRGTLIRIFDTQTQDQIGEFRRGNTDANIYSLSFSFDDSLLGLTSDHGSCHIFSLGGSKMNQKNDGGGGVMNYLTGNFLLGGVGKKISTALAMEHSWKKIEIPHKAKTLISFIKEDNNNVFIIDKIGNYISINLTNEAEPKITKKVKLI